MVANTWHRTVLPTPVSPTRRTGSLLIKHLYTRTARRLSYLEATTLGISLNFIGASINICSSFSLKNCSQQACSSIYTLKTLFIVSLMKVLSSGVLDLSAKTKYPSLATSSIVWSSAVSPTIRPAHLSKSLTVITEFLPEKRLVWDLQI